jgi:CheY-like chemotaxis protein
MISDVKKRVLIIDDDNKSRRLIEAHLSSMGFETVFSATYHDAMEILFRDSEFDLIITDLIPHHPSGIDLSKKLRESKILGDIPIIGTSTFYHWNMLRARSARDLGLSGLVLKPVTKNVLKHAIQKILRD